MSDQRAPLWKQLLGALAGAGLALVFYGAYQVSQPVVTAYITPLLFTTPGDEGYARTTHRGMTQEHYDRFASRNREVMEALRSPAEFVEDIDEYSDVMAYATSGAQPHADYIAETGPNPPTDPLPSEIARMEEEMQARVQMAVEPVQLPDSGIGVWVACIAALAVTALLWKDRWLKTAA